MATLRLRRLPALSSSLALTRRTTPLHVRTYTALRSSSTPRQRSLLPSKQTTALARFQQFSTSPTHYETIVKVPQMAESISEGTLSSFSKQVGDYVEQDEEIASIETDKIDVSVNAPEAGTIKEFLVSEGDTVTVGQDLAKIEPGEGSGGAKEAKEEPKEPASKDQPTSSDPEPKKEEKKDDSPPPAKKEEKAAPPKEEKKPAPAKEEKKASSGEQKEGIESPYGKGNRNENRVSAILSAS